MGCPRTTNRREFSFFRLESRSSRASSRNLHTHSYITSCLTDVVQQEVSSGEMFHYKHEPLTWLTWIIITLDLILF